MTQERPEVPPSTDALLEGYEGRSTCKACDLEKQTYASPEEATSAHEALKSTPHTCGKSALTVGEALEAWALAGQPGAPQGAPCVPPGTTLAR
jgi:hypothetical protein